MEEWRMKGFFEHSDLLNINSHWMELKLFQLSGHFTLAVIYTVVLLAEFSSDVLFIYIIV